MASGIIPLIKAKRDGLCHSAEELAWLVDHVGELPDYQLAAWLMAVVCRGMDLDETVALTDRMARSGEVLDLSDVPGPRVDKHSTGGVGDKVTLVLGPLVAAAGATVAKLSGRGLGHTGGTIDKLEAIPGLRTDLSPSEFKAQLRECRIAIAGQTANLAPADGVLYALRDVTGTVESVPLIAASVLSKKIASGADVILLDVKVGSGAFMRDMGEAEALARTMLAVGERLGKAVCCVVSEMGQPLGSAIGHANEVAEAMATLRGEGPSDLTELCVSLGALMLVGGGLAPDAAAAEAHLRGLLADGRALAKLRELVVAQGGDPAVIEDSTRMPQAPLRHLVRAPREGIVQELDALTVGLAGKALGAGRLIKGAAIDLAVGVNLHKKIADAVQAGEPLAELLARTPEQAAQAERELLQAYRIGAEPVTPAPLIKAIFAPDRLTRDRAGEGASVGHLG